MANIRTIYGKRYDLDNPQDAAEVLRIQKQEQLKKSQKALSPNRIINPQKRMEAANLLAQNQAMENANAGVMTVAPTVESLLRPARETRENRLGLINFGKNDNRPKKINTNAGGLLNLPLPPNSNLQLNQQTQNLLNNQVDQSSTQSQPVQSAQPQPKRTLGQRASGLFDRASNAYMGAAPILAVAQEFQKAGALRPIGTPMQGDPYGKMMEIQQNRQQAENLAQLREQYPQFANLSDKNFEKVITELSIKGELNKTGTQTKPLSKQQYAEKFPKIYEGDSKAAEGYGFFDTVQKGISKVTGAVGLPLKDTEIANAATQTYNKEVMEAQKTKYNTRDSVFQMKYTMEMLPTPKMNEYQALQQHYNIRDVFEKAKIDLEAELNDPTINLTGSQEAKLREGIRKFNNIVLRSNNRISSLEKARGVSMNVTSSTPNWEGSMQEAESAFKVLEDVRAS